MVDKRRSRIEAQKRQAFGFVERIIQIFRQNSFSDSLVWIACVAQREYGLLKMVGL